MKRFVSVICIAAMLVLMLALTACGQESVEGQYKLVGGTVGGEDILDTIGSTELFLSVEGDKATLEFMGETLEWEVDSAAHVMRSDDGSEASYRLEDNQLILESDNGDDTTDNMIFEKQD